MRQWKHYSICCDPSRESMWEVIKQEEAKGAELVQVFMTQMPMPEDKMGPNNILIPKGTIVVFNELIFKLFGLRK